MDPLEISLIAGRTAAIYICLLLVVRLSGRRPLASFSPLDLIVVLVVGEIASRPVYGDLPLWVGLALVSLLSVTHYVGASLLYSQPRLSALFVGSPRVLIRNGEVSQRGLAAERISERDLRALLRERGVERLDEVKLATLEPSGVFSVVRTEQARRLRRGDLEQLLVRVQGEATP